MPRILLVDDDPDILETLRYTFEHAGWEVDVATDGLTALATAQERPPAVAVLDVMLPGMNGYELSRPSQGRGARRPFARARRLDADGAARRFGGAAGLPDHLVASRCHPLETVRPGDAVGQGARSRGAARCGGRPCMTRILIVDDDQDIARILRFRLEKKGFDCVLAATGWKRSRCSTRITRIFSCSMS
jgi:CheY-like chemotaxis protein